VPVETAAKQDLTEVVEEMQIFRGQRGPMLVDGPTIRSSSRKDGVAEALRRGVSWPQRMDSSSMARFLSPGISRRE
jgi:hypothetical protein